MKVIALNGSPRKKGNTYDAIQLVANELKKAKIETEIIQIGGKTFPGCTGCGYCLKQQNERCVVDDEVNMVLQKLKESDGLILASPVHFAGISGSLKSFLDRLFYTNGANGNFLAHKVGTSLAAVRRAGALPTLEGLNYYLQYTEMIMPTSVYWNGLFGRAPGEIEQDGEGVQTARVLGKNMAWLMKVLEEGKKKFPLPSTETKEWTNFIK